MKAFETILINGRLRDPALFVLLMEKGEACLFDLGDITRFRIKNIHKISSVFISHAHLDHFVGFDHFLRVMLGQRRTLRLYGPEGFVDKVYHRLQGYSWNLVKGARLNFEVYEVSGENLEGKRFCLREKFQKAHPLPSRPHQGVLWENEMYRISFAVLDHKIDSLAFSLVRKSYPRVDKEKLAAFAHKPGIWLRKVLEFSQKTREDERISLGTEEFSLSHLAGELLVQEKEEKIAYVVDTLYSPEVESKVLELAQGADLFFCEAAYQSKDRKKARTNHHLCADQAGLMARKAGAKKFIPFHFSWCYNGAIRPIEREAKKAFEEGKMGEGEENYEL